MRNYLSVDRIENNFAVCIDDNEKQCDIKLSEIPFDVYEGQILYIENNKIFADTAEEVKRKNLAYELTKRLFNK